MANITFVDAQDNVIGYGSRVEAIEKGIIHRIARVFVFDSKGTLLIQKRSEHSTLPGRWDQSAAGHVDEGEEYATAAARELAEEVGIRNAPLQETLKLYTEETDETKVKKRFNTLYVCHYDGEIRIDTREVSEARWIMPDELHAWMEKRPGDFTQGFISCFEKYLIMQQLH